MQPTAKPVFVRHSFHLRRAQAGAKQTKTAGKIAAHLAREGADEPFRLGHGLKRDAPLDDDEVRAGEVDVPRELSEGRPHLTMPETDGWY